MRGPHRVAQGAAAIKHIVFYPFSLRARITAQLTEILRLLKGQRRAGHGVCLLLHGDHPFCFDAFASALFGDEAVAVSLHQAL